MQPVFAQYRIPDGEAWNNSGVGTQRDPRQTACCASRNFEVIHENALWGRHVGVHENADRLTLFHGAKKSADKIIFVYGGVAVHCAVLMHQAVEIDVV